MNSPQTVHREAVVLMLAITLGEKPDSISPGSSSLPSFLTEVTQLRWLRCALYIDVVAGYL